MPANEAILKSVVALRNMVASNFMAKRGLSRNAARREATLYLVHQLSLYEDIKIIDEDMIAELRELVKKQEDEVYLAHFESIMELLQ